jgi:sterol desaturase/sphingolipid hydroxylase (fatty acid hydroxylase superfamily)
MNGAHKADANASRLRAFVAATVVPVVWFAAMIAAYQCSSAGYNGLLTAVGVGTVVVSIATVLEIAMPYRRSWHPRWIDVRVDGISLAMTTWVVAAVVGVAMPTLVAVSEKISAVAVLPLWSALPLPMQIVAALVVSQLVSYWWHRLHHTVPWFWRFHAFHHSADKLYWMNSARTHPLEDLGLQLLAALVLLMVGAPPQAVALTNIAVATFGTFQHSNIDLRWGFANVLLATSQQHRWHHSSNPDDANCNYGSMLLLWDHIFRSYRAFPIDAPDRLGTGGELKFPTGYLAQLVAPLRWKKDYESLQPARLGKN